MLGVASGPPARQRNDDGPRPQSGSDTENEGVAMRTIKTLTALAALIALAGCTGLVDPPVTVAVTGP